MRAVLTCILSALGLFALAPAASAFPGWFPECYAPEVMQKVISRFNGAVYYHVDGARIVDIDQPAERFQVYFGPYPIPRRYCQGRALMAAGHYRPVYYLIEGGMGLAGFGWNVEFCIPGHDRWHVYDGDCRVLVQRR